MDEIELTAIINLLAAGLVWTAFGFWCAIASVILKITLTEISRYDGSMLGTFLNIGLSVYAINTLWHEPMYNIGYLIIVVLLIIAEVK